MIEHCMLEKVLDKIKEMKGIKKFDDTKIQIWMVNCQMKLL